MKAVLHEKTLEKYETIYEGQKSVEISGEMVVSDKLPDIGLLGNTSAHVLLRSKRVETGRCMMDGEVSTSIFYTPDGGSGFHVLNMQLPWKAEFEEPEITNDSSVICDVYVERLETRMLNPRKILVKAKLSCSVMICAQLSVCVYDAIDDNAVIQARQSSTECSIIATVCEKTFAATDEYPLPPDISGGEVISKNVQFRVEDVKTLANKLIVKGNVLSDVVIASENGTAGRVSFNSPFSLIAETGCEKVSDNVSICIMPTAMYYELTSTGAVLSVEVHGVCQMTVYENLTVTCLTDAYSNFYPCIYESDNLNVYQNVKRMMHRENVSGRIECHSELSCVRFLTSACNTESVGDKMQVSITVGAYVRYENGASDWIKKLISIPLVLKDGERLRYARLGDLYGSCAGTDVEFRMTMEWESIELAPISLRYLTEVTWNEEQNLEQRSASFTVVREGGQLWELARKYASTVELIRLYNGMEKDEDSADCMLLIPTQRQ